MAANCNVLSRKYEERAEFDNLKATRGSLSPSCNLTLNANRGLQKQRYNNSQNSVSISFDVEIPIFSNSSQGNSYSAVALADQRAQKAKFTANDTLLEVKKECIDNWNKYISAGAMIKASHSAVKSAELSAESNQEEAFLGTKSNTEILVEENQLLDARIQLANSRKQKVISGITILALSGDLNLRTLFKKKK
jgi:outer membrane protein TolC